MVTGSAQSKRINEQACGISTADPVLTVRRPALYIEGSIEMVLYGLQMPELKAENATEIIQFCQKMHQDSVDKRKRNTQLQRWDKYWVAAYNVVLEQLTN